MAGARRRTKACWPLDDDMDVMAASGPEWPVVVVGAAKAGLVLVTMNPVLRAAEVEYIHPQAGRRAGTVLHGAGTRLRPPDHDSRTHHSCTATRRGHERAAAEAAVCQPDGDAPSWPARTGGLATGTPA